MAGENHPLKPTQILRRQKQKKPQEQKQKNPQNSLHYSAFPYFPPLLLKIPMSSCLERRLKNLRQFLTEVVFPFEYLLECSSLKNKTIINIRVASVLQQLPNVSFIRSVTLNPDISNQLQKIWESLKLYTDFVSMYIL